jgi:hypothetical protein
MSKTREQLLSELKLADEARLAIQEELKKSNAEALQTIVDEFLENLEVNLFKLDDAKPLLYPEAIKAPVKAATESTTDSSKKVKLAKGNIYRNPVTGTNWTAGGLGPQPKWANETNRVIPDTTTLEAKEAA